MPVSVTEKATTASARVEDARGPGSSRSAPAATRSVTAAPLGELEGVGEQVLEHLLQPLGVGAGCARGSVAVDARSRSRGPCCSATWRKVRST